MEFNLRDLLQEVTSLEQNLASLTPRSYEELDSASTAYGAIGDELHTRKPLPIGTSGNVIFEKAEGSKHPFLLYCCQNAILSRTSTFSLSHVSYD